MSNRVETFEAMCGAFYRMPFTEFLGEKDLPWYSPLGEGKTETARHAWFHFGEHPKDMRVTVICPEASEMTVIRVEWRNYFSDGRRPLKGEQTFTIPTYGARYEVTVATEEVAVKVLEIFKQVVSETGVAGRLSELVEAPGE